jgi:hypothetical protein
VAIKRIDSKTRYGKPTHWYQIDGRKADGVTTVLKNTVPKPALINWAPKVVAEWVADHPEEIAAMADWNRDKVVNELKGKPWEQRDAAGNRGTEVHALAERLVKGEEVAVPEELSGYVESYVKFLDEWQPKPVLVEAVVASRKWTLAGTLDLVADLPNGERALMDLKTSKGVYPETALQCAAYRWCEIYLDGDGNEQSLSALGVNASYVVHVRADGYDVRPLDTSEDVWKVYQHLIWLSRRMGDAMKPWLGAAEPAPTEVLL